MEREWRRAGRLFGVAEGSADVPAILPPLPMPPSHPPITPARWPVAPTPSFARWTPPVVTPPSVPTPYKKPKAKT